MIALRRFPTCFCLFLFAAGLFFVCAALRAEPAEEPRALREFQDAFAGVIERVKPSVVKVRGAGVYSSGVIVSPEGLVITNRRVGAPSSGKSTVILNDGSELEASVLAVDVPHDIALLAVSRRELSALPLARREAVRGEWAAVVGKAFYRSGGDIKKEAARRVQLPLAHSDTVTLGIVNVRDRLHDPQSRRDFKGTAVFIDALINPGCEGGAVVNAAGELLGVVGQLQDDGRTWDEIDFAADASAILALAERAGKPLPPSLGAGNFVWPELGATFRAAADRVLPSLARIQIQWPPKGILEIPDKGGAGPFTGLVVAPDGLVVTAASHFPPGWTPAAITVSFSDGRSFSAEILARDHRSDLVLLRLSRLTEQGPFPPAPEFADPAGVKPGALCVAVSASFGFPEACAIHAGIISAVDRDQNALQTDVTLLLANRGGPLVDRQGRVLGILTQLIRQPKRESEQKNGVAFAIPYPVFSPNS